MQVRYYDQCRWVDVADGLIFQFVDDEGEPIAEVGLKDSESQLWRFEVMLPERYRWNSTNPAGLVCTQPAARRIAEMILLNTIVTR